jgi:uncharacterized repeat protein (TIGR01451 family)
MRHTVKKPEAWIPAVVLAVGLLLRADAPLTALQGVEQTGPLASMRGVTSELFSGIARWLRAPLGGVASFSEGAAQQAATEPVVWTDRTGYLAGETVSITGAGFAGDEEVTLQVKHADGGEEPGAGHDPFTTWTDAAGTFTATWELGDDLAGNSFVLSAAGTATGPLPSVAFSRIATVQTDKYDYQAGETAVISGAGFRPVEVVTIQVEHSNGDDDGAGHEPFEAIAEPDGRISAQWLVDPDDSEGSIFRLTATGTDSGLRATSTFTDLLVTVIDDDGPDDEPGQKDLNQMSSDPGATAVAITWNWDDTDFGNLGGNTGDACALVDTDFDGNANYSFCVVADGNPAVQISNRLYTCTDTKSDRCTGPTLVPTFTSTSTASVVDDSDPFKDVTTHHDANDCDANVDPMATAPSGCNRADTVANVTLQLSDVGGASVARLINVCSYPSQQPNSDPSDCVVTPESGFLTIVKQADPNDGTAFVFTSSAPSQNGTSSWTINGSGSTAQFSFAPGTYDLTETVPAGWDLTNASCAIQTAPPTSTGTFDPNTDPDTINNFEIQSGLETICTFTNTQDLSETHGRIIVQKETDPDGDTTSFEFDPSWDANFFLSDGQSNDSDFTLAPGPYSVAEITPAGWDLTSTVCTSSAGDSETADSISLQAGETVTCVFTNTKQNPALLLDKTITSGDPYDAVGDVINYSFLVTNTGNVSLAGPVTIADNKATDESCPAVTTVGNLDGFLDPGEAITCTASYTITQADLNAGSVTNTATASADGTNSNEDTQTANAAQSPKLTLVKSADPLTYDSVGDIISYDYVLTNSGNVTLNQPFTVTDDKAVPTCLPVPAILAPGESITCTASYLITQADLDAGAVTNIATGHGFALTTMVDSNEDTETVTAEREERRPEDPVVVLTMTTSPTITPGSLLQYKLDYANVGPAPSQSARIIDYLPPGVTFVSASNGGTYDAVTRTVTWNLGTVPISIGSVNLVVRVPLTTPAGSVLLNRAEFTGLATVSPPTAEAVTLVVLR